MDDRELLRAWKTGDQRAGNELFERHFRSVYRFFESKVPDRADELTQRTFLGCVESKERMWEDASFRAYLFGIARKQLLKYFERRRVRLPPEALSTHSIADLRPGPSRAPVANDTLRATLEAMRRLPVEAQMMLELYYWEEMPVADIAAALEIPIGTVKSRIHRARAKLAEHLGALGQAPTSDASVIDQARALSAALQSGREPDRSG